MQGWHAMLTAFDIKASAEIELHVPCYAARQVVPCPAG